MEYKKIRREVEKTWHILAETGPECTEGNSKGRRGGLGTPSPIYIKLDDSPAPRPTLKRRVGELLHGYYRGD
jgi:hypothetical protein